MMNNIDRKHLLYVLILLTLIIGERAVFDIGANIELITAGMILTAFYVNRESALWLVLITLVISDAFLGNTNIFLFTWTGFLIPAFLVSTFFKKLLHRGHCEEPAPKQSKTIRRDRRTSFAMTTTVGTGLGIFTSVFFYLWTNFGVWLLDSWGMYSNDLTGLMMSYTNALPFFRANLLSTLIFVPTGFFITEAAIAVSKLIINPRSDKSSSYGQPACRQVGATDDKRLVTTT